MKFEILQENGQAVAVIQNDGVLIHDVQSALDIMATIRYETDCDRIIMDRSALCDAFFDLKTRMAGEILQKFVQYQMKIALVGDFSQYTSKSLQSFIYESNRGNDVFFLPNQAQAISKLSLAR